MIAILRLGGNYKHAKGAASRFSVSDLHTAGTDVSTIELAVRDGVQLECSKCSGGIDELRKRESQRFESATDLCRLLHSERDYESMQLPGILELESIAG